MDGAWIGKRVSLNCGVLGFYQGIVKSIQLEESTITIREVFQNGVASSQPHVTLRSQDIQAIKVLKSENEPSYNLCKSKSSASTTSASLISQSVASLTQGKKCPSLVPSSGHPNAIWGPPSSHPNLSSNSKNHNRRRQFVADNLRNNSNGMPRRARDEEAFGHVDSFDMTEEFDFEKNLALFDKRIIFRELDEKLRSSPKANSATNETPSNAKYRNDENVLPSGPVIYRPITAQGAIGEYVTDSGLIIPAINLQNRLQIICALNKFKFSWDKIVELFARAATDIALQTLGASHRLNPTNSHQIPTAVVLCGRGRIGSFGLAIARLFLSHGVKTLVYVPCSNSKSDHPTFNSELQLFKMFNTQIITNTKDLPQEYTEVDAVINALESFDTSPEDRSQPWFKKAYNWMNTRLDTRTHLLSIDPSPSQLKQSSSLKIPTKITIVPGLLPFSFTEKDSGKLYMINIGIPEMIFKSAGIQFSSPYGAKSAIQLHRK